MLHEKRRWLVPGPFEGTATELATKMKESTWTLCTG